jgi:hypothetical protein
MKSTITITEDDKEDTPDRLRLLLEMAEERQGCRFALITFGDGMVVTTSSKEPTDFDRMLLACFSREARSTDAAWHAGVARGIALATQAFKEHGEDDAPAILDEARRGDRAMTPTTQDVSRRLAAHPRFRWMAGMREDSGDRVNRIEGDRIVYVDREGDVESRPANGCYFGIPDLDDPATQGCLIAMLGDDFCERQRSSMPGMWLVWIFDPHGCPPRCVSGTTQGEALGRAVLAKWGEP